MLKCRLSELSNKILNAASLQLENSELSKKVATLQEANLKFKEFNDQNKELFEKMMEQETGFQFDETQKAKYKSCKEEADQLLFNVDPKDTINV